MPGIAAMNAVLLSNGAKPESELKGKPDGHIVRA